MADQGAGLRIGKDVQDFLAPFLPVGTGFSLLATEMRVLGRDGGIVRTVPIDAQTTSWGVLWGVVRGYFGEGCDGGNEFVHGARVERVGEAEGGKARVEYLLNGKRKEMDVDLVVGADGASSVIRQNFLPEVKRTYAGYVTWRGLLPEREMSAELKADFVHKSTWGWSDATVFVAYLVPGENGAMEDGARYLNWGWYENLSEEVLGDALTDVDGLKRMFAVPFGKLRPQTVKGVRERSSKLLAPQFAEIICKSEKTSVHCVTDVMATQTSFLGAKVVLVGDAAAGAR
jgi:2-polyprenyl-6-methoxyphenol hydroxylase-like FAD-dependent oxidoreductase